MKGERRTFEGGMSQHHLLNCKMDSSSLDARHRLTHDSTNATQQQRCGLTPNYYEYLFFLFSPLGKVAGRAIYFTDVFSLFFFNFFLMVDFLANVAETLIEQSSPKFQDW